MAAWKECLLGDVVNLKRGYDLPQSARSPGRIPVVSSSGVTDHHSEAKVRGPGVVTGRYGTLGQVFFIENDYWPLNTSLYVQDFKGNDPRFVSYFLGSLNFVSQNAAGAVPGVNRNHLHAMAVRVPPRAIQHRIAGILSAYDELIENSQRRIKILESMARTLYREWFVHFRFPGHETVPRVASALGEIPKGWDVRSLGDMTNLVTKGTTPTSLGREFQQDGINFIKAESIENSGVLIESKFAKIDVATHELLQRSQLSSGDILFSIAGVIGRVCSVPSRILPANTNQALAIIRCASAIHAPFLYMTLRDDVFRNHCLGHVVQTAQANVSLSVLRGVPIICPTSALFAEFNSVLEPLLKQIQVLSERVENLRHTRDLLLPRLLSGQIDVEAIANA